MLSACGAAPSAREAFHVGDSSVSVKDFDAITAALVDVGQFTATNGAVSGDDARSIIRQLVQYRAALQMLDDLGVAESPSDRLTIEEKAAGDPNFATYPEVLQNLLVELNVVGLSLAGLAQPSESKMKSLYEAAPASTGALCLSHILVKTEGEARDVLDELDRGTAFADLARRRSIEPAAATTAGSLGNGTEPCQLLGNLQSSFDRDFMVGAVAAKAGVPTGPVKTQFGYHIILSRPWSEVGASVMSATAQEPGSALLTGYMATADVVVNSKYGTWVGAVGSVL